jgi:membrane-associated phospholipid phosphatase
MSSRPLPLDRWLLGHRRGALILAAALLAFVAIAWVVIQCSGILAWFALARGNRPLLAAMLLVILGMGPFRIVAGEHWPSDVLAGYALGIAWTTVVLVLGLPWAAGQPAGEPAAGRS